MAVANYHDVEGHYPPPYIADKDGRPMHSWRVLILPYIEQQELYKEYRFDEPWDGPNNRQLAGRMPKMYALHGDYRPGTTTTNYVAIVGPRTVWRPDRRTKHEDVKDGAANTLLIAENRGHNIHWMEPRDLDFDGMDWSGNSPHGVSSKYDAPAAVFLDGSVRRLPRKLTPVGLQALVTIDGGEPVGPDGEFTEPLRDGRDRPVTNP